MRHMIFIAIALALAAPVPAQDELADPHALGGLNTVHLDLGDISLAGGVTVSGLTQRIRARLESAGFDVTGREDAPTLTLDIHLLQNTTDGLIVGSMNLSLTQPGFVVREEGDTAIPTVATTWNATSLLMAAPGDETLRALIIATVDNLTAQFLRAHREVNGRRRSPSAQQPSLIRRFLPFL